MTCEERKRKPQTLRDLLAGMSLAARQEGFIISSKAGYLMWPGPYGEWGSRKYLLTSIDQSLRRLELDYIDIFYLHRPAPETPLQETLGALDQIVRQGAKPCMSAFPITAPTRRLDRSTCWRAWARPA